MVEFLGSLPFKLASISGTSCQLLPTSAGLVGSAPQIAMGILKPIMGLYTGFKDLEILDD